MNRRDFLRRTVPAVAITVASVALERKTGWLRRALRRLFAKPTVHVAAIRNGHPVSNAIGTVTDAWHGGFEVTWQPEAPYYYRDGDAFEYRPIHVIAHSA